MALQSASLPSRFIFPEHAESVRIKLVDLDVAHGDVEGGDVVVTVLLRDKVEEDVNIVAEVM